MSSHILNDAYGQDFPDIAKYQRRHTEILNRCWRYIIQCSSFFFRNSTFVIHYHLVCLEVENVCM